ncbi:MAG: alginate O-acetyltransferase AlgF [Rhodanobacter sp.]
MKTTFLLSSVTALIAIAPLAQAQMTGRLYDPMPPDNSSYLRVLDTVPGQPVSVLVDGKVHVKSLPARTVSDYLVIPSGKHHVQVTIAGKSQGTVELDLVQKNAYTVVFPNAKSHPWTFTDRTSTNKLKSMLAVYNVDPLAGPLDVKTADGKTKVFTSLEAGQPAILEVNPINVKLAVFKSGTTTASGMANLTMQRGSAYSLFLLPAANGLEIVSAQNHRERYTGK